MVIQTMTIQQLSIYLVSSGFSSYRGVPQVIDIPINSNCKAGMH